MSTEPVNYTPEAIPDLTSRTEYEAWLLEAVYDLAKQPIAVSLGDGLIYPLDGSDPRVHHYLEGKSTVGDWGPMFLEVGSPLVFVTSFKLLDMIIEWVLVQNRIEVPFQFSKKSKFLERPIVFPPLIKSRPWLRERIIALYKELGPLRNTIIHNRHFQATGGTLAVSRSEGRTIETAVKFSSDDLRNLVVILVSLLRYLEGFWTMDLFQEKRIRRALDELNHLHRLSSMNQLPPTFLTVRAYVSDEDLIEINLDRIQNDITTKFSGQDVLFEIRVVAVARDGQIASAYLIGWDQLQNAGPRLQRTRADLMNSMTPVPDNIVPSDVARDLGL